MLCMNGALHKSGPRQVQIMDQLLLQYLGHLGFKSYYASIFSTTTSYSTFEGHKLVRRSIFNLLLYVGFHYRMYDANCGRLKSKGISHFVTYVDAVMLYVELEYVEMMVQLVDKFSSL